MTKNMYHIRPNGEVGKCEAKIKCKYGFNEQEHFETKETAQKAYEETQKTKNLHSLSKNNKPIDVLKEQYWFDHKSDEYGIAFTKPDIEGAYFEKYNDSEYWRFEQMEEIFHEFDKNDVQLGYSMDVELHTLQRFLSEEVVQGYENVKNPFAKSLYSYGDDNMNEDDQSLTIILAHKGKLFVVDGNHRFAAAKRKGLKAFAAVVIGASDNMERMWLVSPEKFNNRYAKS